MTTASATGAAMPSDRANNEANRLFNTDQPLEVMLTGLNTARDLMRNRADGIKADFTAHLDAIRQKGIFAEPPPVTSEQGKPTPSVTAIIPPDIDKLVPPYSQTKGRFKQEITYPDKSKHYFIRRPDNSLQEVQP